MSVRILVGDVREKLAELPSDHFDCVICSPPYWGLRKYIAPGAPEERFEIGLEPTLGEHLNVMVEVMREVRRVLKPRGTLWLNLGDCYAAAPNGRSAADTKLLSSDDRTFRDKPFSTVGPIYERQPDSRQAQRRGRSGNLTNGGVNGAAIPDGRVVAGGTLKAKDLCMIPNRLAICLQDDGWWVRSEIIWGKSNPMPESIRDRPATAHEKIFLLTKSARYFWNGDAVRQGRTQNEDANSFRGGSYINGEPSRRKVRGNKIKMPDGWDTAPGAHGRYHRAGREKGQYSQPYGGQSVKDYGDLQNPSDVKRRIVEGKMAGTIPEGRNLRNYEPAPLEVWPMATRPFSEAHFATFPPELVERCLAAGCPAGGQVLDPFGGAGTTGLVADRLGLDCTLIELNPAYAEIAERRIASDAGMFASVETAA